jgi:hypothetical protein
MKTLEITRNTLFKTPYRTPPVNYGRPGPRHLSKWIYKLDLDKYNILVKEPLDCLNFVVEHMNYYSDQITHKTPEHWLQSSEQVYNWIFHKRTGDCDDSAITLASLLHSVGNKDVRLSLGYYGDPRYADVSRVRMNHAYCLLENSNNNYSLIDPVGDRSFNKLEDIDNHPEYITMVSAAADGRIWIHEPWIKAFT